MSNEIKAIETNYKGYRFRSRAEARWAVFFGALGIKWEYEKEGFDIDGVRYLPDFYLPESKAFFEVKGSLAAMTDEELEKINSLVRSGRLVTVGFSDFTFRSCTKKFDYETGRIKFELVDSWGASDLFLCGNCKTFFFGAHYGDGVICPCCSNNVLTDDHKFMALSCAKNACDYEGAVEEKGEYFEAWVRSTYGSTLVNMFDLFGEQFDGENIVSENGSILPVSDDRKIFAEAVNAARGARFEHGEHGGK